MVSSDPAGTTGATGRTIIANLVDVRDANPPPAYPDVYFTPGYGAAVAAAEGGAWHLAYAPGRIMAPYLVRPISDGLADGISPYGYSGIHVNADCPPGELIRCWPSVVDGWRASGLVSMLLRFSPLDPASVAPARALGLVAMTRRGDTVTVAVDHGPAAVWDGMAGRARNTVRKARRAGLEASVRPAGIDDLTAGSAFRRLYEQTMRRVHSSPSYLLPNRYYQLLLDGLGKSLLIAEVRDKDGAVVASSLLMRHGDRLHYHLAGSDLTAARNGANNLMLWTVFEWAAGGGLALVHLGGGVRPDDSLFQFKRSFGGTVCEFWTGSLVLDQVRYDALVVRQAARLNRPPADLLDSGFFPAYRHEPPPVPA